MGSDGPGMVIVGAGGCGTRAAAARLAERPVAGRAGPSQSAPKSPTDAARVRSDAV